MAVRVLYLIDSLAYGGTERQLVELIRNLDRSRVEPHLCTLKPSNQLFDELNLPKICLGYRSFLSPLLLGNLYRLHRFIRQHRIQVVQTFFQDPFLLAALIRPFNSVHLIGSFRDLGFWRTSAESWKMRLAYPFFSGFLANSQAVKEHFVARDGLVPHKVGVIYNGFDNAALEACMPPTNREPGICTVGMVANLNRQVKRVDDFIRAAALLHRNRPGTRFVIIGDGDLRGGLERLAAELGVAGAVQFLGRIANPLPLIGQFQVGVISSETEGFCNAIIEYMACGVPVVATNVGGNPELIAEGVNGFLVPVGDCHAMAARLALLVDDATLRSRIGSANRSKVSAEYTLPVMIERQSSYYEGLVR